MTKRDVIFTDWDFFHDVQTIYNQSISERKWLCPILQERLNKSEKGVLIASDMGFGKSSIVSLLVCSPVESSWYEFRKKLLVYHMCRYDVETTKQPHIFVRNLAYMLMNRFEQIRSAIEKDDVADSFLIGSKCERDPIGCLVRIVLQPIETTWKDPINKTELLIVIDAADECSFADGRLDVVSLISHSLSKFPKGFKFIITSRYLLVLKNSLNALDHLDLQSFSTRISVDLEDYAKIRIDTHDAKKTDIVNLVKISEGNFLLLRVLIDYFNENNGQGDPENNPTTLFQFYTGNLKRIFGKDGEKFDFAKKLFEIICTSSNPLSTEEIYYILNEPNKTEKRNLRLYLRNEMRHFLKCSDDSFTFLHKSIKDYFESLSEDSTFYVDLKKGHERFAKYLIKDLTSGTWLQTAVHVHKSENKEFLSQFNKSSANINVKNINIDRIISTIDSIYIMEIYVSLAPPFNINLTNDESESLAFTASKLGHVNILSWLIENGADIQFEKTHRFMTKFTISYCKYVYHCGYNLLEIAAQGGHLSVLKMLLTIKQTMLSHKTYFGLTAFDVACENGHFEIAKYLAHLDIHLPSQHSLYLAAKNNHLEVVNMLLQLGVRDVCVSCNSRNKVYSLLKNEFSNDVFSEDAHLVFCETVLHVAVRNCHVEVIKLLVKLTDSVDSCYDVFGMTPLLSSVKYKCEQAFIILSENNANSSQVCIKNYDSWYENGMAHNLHRIITENICPKGTSIVHFITVNNQISLANYLKSKGFSNWDIRDKNGVTPYHLGHCHMNKEMFYFWKDLVKANSVAVSTRSLNGSTPYHASALCRNDVSVLLHNCPIQLMQLPRSWWENLDFYLQCLFFISLRDGIPYVVDYQNKSAFYYYFLTFQLESYNINILKMFTQTNTDLNFALYFAVLNRRYKEANIILDGLDEEKTSVLRHADRHSFNLLEQIFYNEKSDMCVYIWNTLGSNLTDILKLTIYDSRRLLLDNLVTSYTELHININITKLLYMAVNNSDCFNIIWLRRYFSYDFVNITSNPFHVRNLIHLSKHDSFLIWILIAERGLCCDLNIMDTFGEILKIDKMIGYKYSADIYKIIFNKQNIDCLNILHKDGYNFLHKAINEGNLHAVRQLINAGVDLTIPSKIGENVLDIVVNYAYNMNKRHKQKTYVLHQKVYYDQIASELVLYIKTNCRNYSRILNKTNFCTENQTKVGYVHKAAAKGLLKFLNQAYESFGIQIIDCKKKHYITLFHLTQHGGVIAWMGNVRVLTKLQFDDLLNLFLIDHFYLFEALCTYGNSRRYSVIENKQTYKLLCMKIEISINNSSIRILGKWAEYLWMIKYKNLSLNETFRLRCVRINNIRICQVLALYRNIIYQNIYFYRGSSLLQHRIFFILTNKVGDIKRSWMTLECFYNTLCNSEYRFFKSLHQRIKDVNFFMDFDFNSLYFLRPIHEKT